MIIGSVRENKVTEKRISVTPDNVKKFISNGFKVYLEKNSIQTRPVFAGNIFRQPGYKNKNIKVISSLDNADYIMKNALVIGCHQGMDMKHVNWVHHCLENFFKGYSFE